MVCLGEIEPEEKVVKVTTRKMRCRFALQFTDVRGDDGKVETHRDQVRSVFNSPFQPFVLATTSIGQEFDPPCWALFSRLPCSRIYLS